MTLPPCPFCSIFRNGIWLYFRPSLRRGSHSLSWTLDSCSHGCPVYGVAGPERIFELAGAPPLSGSDELMPERLRQPEECQQELAQWWQERLSTYDFSHWPADKLEKWREIDL